MATRCSICGHGRLVLKHQRTDTDRGDVQVDAHCGECNQTVVLTFQLADDAPLPDRDDLYPIINPTDEPSQLLDVGQWITLFRVILEAASKETDKIEARRLGYEAAQCLEEALKFYDDNDLPPESAIFTDATRSRMRDVPHQFSRTHLLSMRAKLPANVTMQRNITESPQPPQQSRPWWRFWGE